MNDQVFQMYVKTITKCEYDGAHAEAALWYDVIETAYGANARWLVGMTVMQLL